MRGQTISRSAYVSIGLMLFALFFGAGNLIFPASLGQNAGLNFPEAIPGFLVTGVGLPLLGVMAIGYSGSRDLQDLSSRVHPVFGLKKKKIERQKKIIRLSERRYKELGLGQVLCIHKGRLSCTN